MSVFKTNKIIREGFLEKMRNGVILDNGYKTKKCLINAIDSKTFLIVLTEGKKRQIRKMCESLGYLVTALKRIRIANIHLDSLEIGKYRHLRINELKKFKKDLGLS